MISNAPPGEYEINLGDDESDEEEGDDGNFSGNNKSDNSDE